MVLTAYLTTQHQHATIASALPSSVICDVKQVWNCCGRHSAGTGELYHHAVCGCSVATAVHVHMAMAKAATAGVAPYMECQCTAGCGACCKAGCPPAPFGWVGRTQYGALSAPATTAAAAAAAIAHNAHCCCCCGRRHRCPRVLTWPLSACRWPHAPLQKTLNPAVALRHTCLQSLWSTWGHGNTGAQVGSGGWGVGWAGVRGGTDGLRRLWESSRQRSVCTLANCRLQEVARGSGQHDLQLLLVARPACSALSCTGWHCLLDPPKLRDGMRVRVQCLEGRVTGPRYTADAPTNRLLPRCCPEPLEASALSSCTLHAGSTGCVFDDDHKVHVGFYMPLGPATACAQISAWCDLGEHADTTCARCTVASLLCTVEFRQSRA
jgi:hypothetical protein